MSLTESTILLGLHSVRMSLFVFGHVVIALFAFRTRQCDFCTHNFHLHVIFLICGPSSIFEHKKKTYSFHSPVHYITNIRGRQAVFCGLLAVLPGFFRVSKKVCASRRKLLRYKGAVSSYIKRETGRAARFPV